MRFLYRREPVLASRAHPRRQSVLRPRIRVRLKHQERFVDILALIDSGADDCLFPVGVASLLGLQLLPENACPYLGMGQSEITAVFETLMIEVGTSSYSLYAGFLDAPIAPALLGQSGFFDQFEVKFSLPKGIIELKPWKK